MTALVEAVRNALCSAGLLHEKARLLCAVSGGVDSVALLHALCGLRGEIPFVLHASHVQHGLRGEDSLKDEQFVRRLCEGLAVQLHVENAGLIGDMADAGIETRARERRREIFLGQMEAEQMDALLLAHHRDDQTETVLMHLLRGAGAEGLCGMRSIAPFGRGVVLRPFLQLPKQMLMAFEHREDLSNREALTPRNDLRLNVLPQLEKLFPGAGERIAGAAETLAVDDRYLAQQADALYTSAVYDVAPLFMLHRAVVQHAPEALARRALRRWWQEGLTRCGTVADERNLSRQDTLALCALLHEPVGACRNLPCGLMARVGERHIHLIHQTGDPLQAAQSVECTIRLGETAYALPHARILQRAADETIPSDPAQVILPPNIIAQRPVLRAPRPADRIHPLGALGSKPLRRFLTDRKIDPILRPALTVLAVGSDVLWIPSICTAETLRVSGVSDGCVCLEGTPLFMSHRS